MPVDFGAALKDAEQSGLIGGGDYLKFKEGDNRFRLMSECLPHKGEFKGESNFKWLCYVLDRKDGKVKPLFMPHSIYKQIAALQTNEDYAFQDVPMPYDLTVNAVGAGTKEVKYTLMPARKNTNLQSDEMALLDACKPLKELQLKLREKQSRTQQPPAPDDDDELRHVDDHIPF